MNTKLAIVFGVLLGLCLMAGMSMAFVFLLSLIFTFYTWIGLYFIITSFGLLVLVISLCNEATAKYIFTGYALGIFISVILLFVNIIHTPVLPPPIFPW